MAIFSASATAWAISPRSRTNSNATNKIPTLSSITQPLGGIFTYAYNSNGQVSSLTDQLGQVTSLVWNASGLRIAAIDALGNRTSYSYTQLGQLASVQNPLGPARRPWFTTRWASRSP